MVKRQQQMFAIVDALFMLILMATVFICLFGLLSSSYSTIMERIKEIGIIRTLGLKGKEINRMFIIEALIIMLSAGTVGVLVGYFTGWLVTSNLSLFADLPYRPIFPLLNTLFLYLLSISFIGIGMYIMLRKSRKRKIVDIYRESM
jgi:putative ABC transport system permease protein